MTKKLRYAVKGIPPIDVTINEQPFHYSGLNLDNDWIRYASSEKEAAKVFAIEKVGSLIESLFGEDERGYNITLKFVYNSIIKAKFVEILGKEKYPKEDSLQKQLSLFV